LDILGRYSPQVVSSWVAFTHGGISAHDDHRPAGLIPRYQPGAGAHNPRKMGVRAHNPRTARRRQRPVVPVRQVRTAQRRTDVIGPEIRARIPDCAGYGPRSAAGAVKGCGIFLSAREGLSRTGEAGSQVPGPGRNAMDLDYHGPRAARVAQRSTRCSASGALVAMAWRPRVSLEKPRLVREHHGLDAVAKVELLQD